MFYCCLGNHSLSSSTSSELSHDTFQQCWPHLTNNLVGICCWGEGALQPNSSGQVERRLSPSLWWCAMSGIRVIRTYHLPPQWNSSREHGIKPAYIYKWHSNGCCFTSMQQTSGYGLGSWRFSQRNLEYGYKCHAYIHVPSLGLHLDDEGVRIAASLSLGLPLFHLHLCHQGGGHVDELTMRMALAVDRVQGVSHGMWLSKLLSRHP